LPDVICDTSPIQYLHQLQALPLLRQLAAQVFVPPAVVAEIATGRGLGLDLPNLDELAWVTVRVPVRILATPETADLGLGESEVLALALEQRDAVAILDEALARRAARMLGVRLTGTLGVLLDAKRVGLIAQITPLLDRLQSLGFRLAPHTRLAVIQLAGE